MFDSRRRDDKWRDGVDWLFIVAATCVAVIGLALGVWLTAVAMVFVAAGAAKRLYGRRVG